MRSVVQTVFNEIIAGTTEQFTDAALNSTMGGPDQFTIQMRARGISGTSVVVTVVMYHSNDNQSWVAKSTLLNGWGLPIGSEVVGWAQDLGSDPTGGFVRLGVALSGFSPVGQVTINFAGRSDA